VLVSWPLAGANAAVSDAWITTKAKIALMTAKDVHASGINVDTVDGVVTLHGKVDSPADKAKAEAEVKKLDGVREVRNYLQVVPERRAEAVKASDSLLKDRVFRALKDDADLRDSSVSVQSVNDGVVLLAGKASSPEEHLEAVQTARAVPGVRRVESEITSPDRTADEEIQRERPASTAGVKRSIGAVAKDTWITSDVKMRLLADDKTPATDINVDTYNGTVTLFGMVPTAVAKAVAEADARKVSGVKRVVNEIEVVPKAQKETVKARDEDLQKKVADTLESRDDLRGTSISTDVKNGVARLTGTVENESQRLEAAIAARSVSGVRAVHDELKVRTAAAR
jgi:osmotically-inducible protein OsmY